MGPHILCYCAVEISYCILWYFALEITPCMLCSSPLRLATAYWSHTVCFFAVENDNTVSLHLLCVSLLCWLIFQLCVTLQWRLMTAQWPHLVCPALPLSPHLSWKGHVNHTPLPPPPTLEGHHHLQGWLTVNQSEYTTKTLITIVPMTSGASPLGLTVNQSEYTTKTLITVVPMTYGASPSEGLVNCQSEWIHY